MNKNVQTLRSAYSEKEWKAYLASLPPKERARIERALEKSNVTKMSSQELIREAVKLLRENSKRLDRIEQMVVKLAASVEAHIQLVKEKR